jgi:hypothetical protein
MPDDVRNLIVLLACVLATLLVPTVAVFALAGC